MMNVWIQQGTIWNLQPVAAEGFRQVIKLYKSKGKDVFVTSGGEGDHDPASFHYLGLAFDIRKMGVNKKEIQGILGDDWDIVLYSWGFHCEYDPK